MRLEPLWAVAVTRMWVVVVVVDGDVATSKIIEKLKSKEKELTRHLEPHRKLVDVE